MSSLYSVIPGLVPSQQEILEAELLVKQTLEGKFPDLDLREGTGLRDLVLRPSAYAFALLKKATDYYFAQNTLGGITDATPEEVVDDILSNWFLERNRGTFAVISSRLYFARQKNVTITTDISFSPDNTLQFFPQESKVYSADSMTYDSYSNEWYLDVTLQASDTGASYNISEGSLLYFTNFDPYFLRGEINFLAQESNSSETNSEFVSRAANSISTRNLINIPSVDSNLRQNFNYLRLVNTVGMGDPDMIRDMIRVSFEDSVVLTPTSASANTGTLTLTVPNHKLAVGQDVILTQAIPVAYNGRHTILSTTSTSITASTPEGPGFISSIPKLARANDPVFIHNGGMVDVYCGDRIASNILQLTTDEFGTAKLVGPIFAYSRSAATGGEAEDTIPFINTEGAQSYTVDYQAKLITAISPVHNFQEGEAVTLSGISQSATIQSISCTGLVVTAITPGVAVAAGSRVKIEGVAPSGYNGEFTALDSSPGQIRYVVPGSISTAGVGVAMTVFNAALDDTYPAEVVDTNTYRLTIPDIWDSEIAAPVTGVLSASSDVTFTVTNPYSRPDIACTVQVSDNMASIYLYNHGFTKGRYLTLSGCSNPALNGSFRILDTPTGDIVRFKVPGVSGTVSSTASITYVTPWYDYGFSSRQVLDLNFGVENANKTASFQVEYFRDVESVQNYLESPDNRVLCGDYLAKGFNLHMLDISVVSYNSTEASSSVLQATISEYLDSLQSGATLVLSDMVAALSASGVSNIQTPIGVVYTKYNRDLTPAETGVITDYLDPTDQTNVFLLRSVSSTSEAV